MGYLFAKSGIVDNIRNYARLKYILLTGALSAVLGGAFLVTKLESLHEVSNYAGAIFYAIIILSVYYKSYPHLRFLEPYGKLGLTNYSFQGIIGVALIMTVFIPNHISMEWIFATMLVLFAAQLLFSTIWLRHFKYGPLEHLWRCATNMTWVKNLIK